MGREIKRVALDFYWPQGIVWKGYLCPKEVYENLPDDKVDDALELWYEQERYDPPAGEGWQLWETVTEGSPVSPVFPDKESFRNYLAGKGYSLQAVDKFIETGWAPSMTVVGRQMLPNIEGLPLLYDDDKGAGE